ncbi:S8 family serine peptidase [Rubrivivax gelatinosus]|uniref:Putative S8 family peptidase n=1 Tax=Rubrivivax gelatinosus (strain NBRC 100245 / IL144) TaxID=983917 RepID=I0HUX7_RUBGI|nr:S8 family serine peptidase [Rubrivivax gelatinosus]BAL96814.1 putative S8 family peptidase [Rubrivivax gelatinosus IL144]
MTQVFKPLRTAVVLAVSAFVCSAAMAAASADSGSVRVIVAYKAGAAAKIRNGLVALGGKVRDDLSDDNAIAISVPKAKLAKLKALAGVDYVEEDVVHHILGTRSNSIKSRKVAAAAASTQTVPYGITLVQADQVTGTPKWTPKICIVDSGIDATHEDLAGNKLAGQNFSGSGSWNTDENAHGTHVAGTIAALDNGLGVVGVNGKKQVSLYISKVFDSTGSASSSTITKAMNACGRAKANIISMSLGANSASKTEKRAIDRLAKKGILFVAAAGNDGTTAVSYPAGFDNVMSVAAVDENKAWASFSQYNSTVDIAGPGVAVVSTVPPNVLTMGVLKVGGATVPSLSMEGAPVKGATGPLADFGFGDAPVAGSMTGKICLISRGNISFADKVVNCQTSGGIGAVIYNNTSGELAGTMGDTVTTIPSVGITQADGATLMGQLGTSTYVAIEPDPAKYASFNGTSMATPHVSAVAGLVWSYFPSCTAQQIRTTLINSALDIGDAGRDDKTGAGLVQAKAAIDRITAMGCGN